MVLRCMSMTGPPPPAAWSLAPMVSAMRRGVALRNFDETWHDKQESRMVRGEVGINVHGSTRSACNCITHLTALRPLCNRARSIRHAVVGTCIEACGRVGRQLLPNAI